jgi:hypothetical protein
MLGAAQTLLLQGGNKMLTVTGEGYEPESFSFPEGIYDEEVKQTELFNVEFKSSIGDAVSRGINFAVVAFGETGSGKRFTLEGDVNSNYQNGLIFMSVQVTYRYVTPTSSILLLLFHDKPLYVHHIHRRSLPSFSRRQRRLRVAAFP